MLLRNWLTRTGSKSAGFGICCDCKIARSIFSIALNRSSIASNAALLCALLLSSLWPWAAGYTHSTFDLTQLRQGCSPLHFVFLRLHSAHALTIFTRFFRSWKGCCGGGGADAEGVGCCALGGCCCCCCCCDCCSSPVMAQVNVRLEGVVRLSLRKRVESWAQNGKRKLKQRNVRPGGPQGWIAIAGCTGLPWSGFPAGASHLSSLATDVPADLGMLHYITFTS